MVFQIRVATKEDAHEIDRLNRDVLPENQTLEEWIELVGDDDTHCYVAYKNDKLVGYCLGKYCSEDKTGYIYSIGVHEEHRHIGVGYQVLLATMNSMSANSIGLHVRVGNKPAQSLYKKLGFVKKYVVDDFYGDGESAYVMLHNRIK
jgi:[ribosomal protein S18]-alanine N-acetyltransferase